MFDCSFIHFQSESSQAKYLYLIKITWKYNYFFEILDIFFHIQNLKSALLFFENFWEDFLISYYFIKKKIVGSSCIRYVFQYVHTNLNVLRNL